MFQCFNDITKEDQSQNDWFNQIPLLPLAATKTHLNSNGGK